MCVGVCVRFDIYYLYAFSWLAFMSRSTLGGIIRIPKQINNFIF